MPDVAVYSNAVQADTIVVTTAETDAVETPGVQTTPQRARVRLHGFAQVTAGVGATAVTLRVRRGAGVGGAIVGEGNPVTVAAGNTVNLSIDVEDSPGEVANQVYTLSVQQTAATGNGTVVQAELAATVGG